ncbi:HAD family hydrolase [Streptomyces sp. NPDC088729]|uniref:HAD family hydrolase n=1 Tax=Streptomyces sp. NPDC088729 TaxID=3365876 RepID=UPI0038214098
MTTPSEVFLVTVDVLADSPPERPSSRSDGSGPSINSSGKALMLMSPAQPVLRVHLVWDWNGTLLDDLSCMVDAVSACQKAIGEPPVDAATYRRQRCLPGRAFHDRLCGRPVTDAEWPTITRTFAEHMAARNPPLRAGATRLLESVARRKHTQSLLSLTDDPQLRREVEQTGLTPVFERIDGRHEPGTAKSVALEQHLRGLGARDRHRVVLIGDTRDDARAARACGIRAVLHSGGFEPAEQLRTAGMPVVHSLDAAARLAIERSPRQPQPALLDDKVEHRC